MDDWLIFQYHFIRAQAESRSLREPLRGLPTHLVLGQRWGDAGGQVDPGDGCSWGKCVGGPPRQIREAVTSRHDAEPHEAKRLIPCCRENPLASG
jgi:hypothetical protein